MPRFLSELVTCVVTAAFVVGCGDSREVEVTGEVTAASGASISGPIRLELYDVEQGDDGEELVLVHSRTLDAPGTFRETADFAGDRVVIRAIDDGDSNQACSPGEAWGEADVAISEDDKTSPAMIALAIAACPAAGE
jgi:hypothetical protein